MIIGFGMPGLIELVIIGGMCVLLPVAVVAVILILVLRKPGDETERSMSPQYLAFDIETAKLVTGHFDLARERPLGITCIASQSSVDATPRIWMSRNADGTPAPRMNVMPNGALWARKGCAGGIDSAMRACCPAPRFGSGTRSPFA